MDQAMNWVLLLQILILWVSVVAGVNTTIDHIYATRALTEKLKEK